MEHTVGVREQRGSEIGSERKSVVTRNEGKGRLYKDMIQGTKTH